MGAHPEVMVRINMVPKSLISGKYDDICEEIDRVFEVIGERENAFPGTGCLPYETDLQAVLKVAEYIKSHKESSLGKLFL